jgi:hypothetical protein
MPADLNGSTLPPNGSPNFIAEIGSSALYLWKFHVDWTTPGNSSLSGPTTIAMAAYNQLCAGTRSCVPQPGTSVDLDGLGDRLMNRLVYRNFGTFETLLVNHSVNAANSGSKAGVRWYEIRNPNGAASLYQQGTFSPDSDSRWMGSIAMDQAGNIALGYSVSSSSVYPSIRFTGCLAGDPLGQMTQGETTIIAGSGSQTGSANRHAYADAYIQQHTPTGDRHQHPDTNGYQHGLTTHIYAHGNRLPESIGQLLPHRQRDALLDRWQDKYRNHRG